MDKNTIKTGLAKVAKVIQKILLILDPRPKKINFAIGGGSYTDGKTIQIGLDEGFYEGSESYKAYVEALGHEPDEKDLRAATIGYGIHETGHCKYTDFKIYMKFGESFKKMFAHCGTTQLHQNVIHQFGMKFNNAIEDGRIEYFLVNAFPGSAKYLVYLRNMHWNLDKEINPSETCQFMMTCCYWATMGLRPQYYNDCPQRLKDNFEKIKFDIDDIIVEPSCQKASDKMLKMFLKIKPYVEELLKEELAQADLMQAIMDMLESMPEEFQNTKAEDQEQANEIAKSGNTITIRKNSSSSGKGSGSGSSSNSEENEDKSDSKEGSGSGSKSEENEDKDKKDSGSGSDSEADKKEGDENSSSSKSDSGKDGKDNKDSKDSKDGKDGKDGKDDKDGKGKKSSSSKRQKAPDYAERGGDESNMSEDSSSTRDNNGQGTNSAGNSAPDDVDETITETDENLISAIEEELQSMLEEINIETGIQEAKIAKEEAQANAKSSSITESEVEAIRNAYNDPHIEDYKAVKVEAKASLPSEIALKGRLFRREIEKTLQTQNDFYLRGTRSGRLNRPALHKIAQNDYKLFEKKIEPNKTNAAIAICWDGSGSMSGTKQQQSTIACSIIEEGLKGLVPLKIINFTTTYGNMVHHYIVKDFNDRDRNHNYAYSYGVSRSFSGGNKDGYSIKVLTKELEKRSEEQKILIVLSDGLPSDYPSLNYAMDDVNKAVKEARKKGIEVISIMFGERGFRESEYENYIRMYESGVISSDPTQIQTELVKLIKRTLFKY